MPLILVDSLTAMGAQSMAIFGPSATLGMDYVMLSNLSATLIQVRATLRTLGVSHLGLLYMLTLWLTSSHYKLCCCYLYKYIIYKRSSCVWTVYRIQPPNVATCSHAFHFNHGSPHPPLFRACSFQSQAISWLREVAQTARFRKRFGKRSPHLQCWRHSYHSPSDRYQP